MIMMIARFICLMLLLPLNACAEGKVVNIYGWTGEIPDFVVRQFEKETGIKVNLATYENNEIMYAKLRASKNPGYDLVMPSSYFVDRMRRQNMLEKLDKTKLTNWKNLNPDFLHPPYDPKTEFSLPYIWGVTGIFVNSRYHQPESLKSWTALWDKRFRDQLMLIDDTREIFSAALLTMGYSVNDTNPEHIKAAYLKLKELMKNVKVFSSDTVISIMVDEDATVGIAWNGDAYKAWQDNKDIRFVYPEEGFVIWVDTFAIPKTAPHKDNAYAFLNFILRPDIAEKIAMETGYPTTNLTAQKMLPAEVRNDPTIYPSKEVMKRGQFQTDVGDETLAIFEKYWEDLKMSN